MNQSILRFQAFPETRDASIAEAIRICRSGGFTEISLFTTDFLHDTFLDDAQLEAHYAHIAECARLIREAGITFSLNIWHTVGMLRVPDHVAEKFGFERQRNLDGSGSDHPSFDPLCPNIRAYGKKIYTLFARLKPRIIFLDDDYFMGFKAPFHPRRIERFCQLYGVANEPEALRALFESQDDAVRREAWDRIERLATEDLADLAGLLRAAVDSVDPSIRMGLMHNMNVPAHMVNAVTSALAAGQAGDQRPIARPQVALYREEAPVHSYPKATWILSYWKNLYENGAELYPECENFPDNEYLKSPEASIAHLACIFGKGEKRPAMSLQTFGRYQPAGESRRRQELLAARAGQFARVSDWIDADTRTGGIGVWNQRGWPMEVLGLPFHAPREAAASEVFFGTSLDDLPEAGLTAVLARGGVFDIESLRALEARSQLAKTGLSIERALGMEEAIDVIFPRNDLPGCYDDYILSYTLWRAGTQHAMPLKVTAPDLRATAHIRDEPCQHTAPFVCQWTGPEGQRFAFVNMHLRHWNSISWRHPWMQAQLAGAVEWVRGSALPIRVREHNALIAIQCLEKPRGRLFTLINYATSCYDGIELALAGELADARFQEIKVDGSTQPLELVQNATGTALHVPGPMPCLGVRFIEALLPQE